MISPGLFVLNHPPLAPQSGLPVPSLQDANCFGGVGQIATSSPHAIPIGDSHGQEVPNVPLEHSPEQQDRITHDMHSSWILQCEFATRAHPDDSRSLTVMTWYLHHDEAPRCNRPRTIQLDNMDHLWLDDLRAFWAHEIREGEPLHLTYVIPCPCA